MPLTEQDVNLSGRTSRASIMSGESKRNHRPHSQKSDLLSATPGVMSMLRTSTETGDIGTFSKTSTRRSAMHRPPRRSGGSPRPSTASSNYNSSRSQHSRSGMRPSTRSSAPYGPRSFTSSLHQPHFVNGTLSTIGYGEYGSTSSLVYRSRPPKDVRSYSMTGSTHLIQPMPSHRSLTSLRSHAVRNPRPHSPFAHPPRLKRPGYRPSSPAMSEATGVQLSKSRCVKTSLKHPLMVPTLPPGAISSTSSESPSSDVPTPPKPCPSPDVHVNSVMEVDERSSTTQPAYAETSNEANGSKPRTSAQTLSFVQRIKSILDEKSTFSNECDAASSGAQPQTVDSTTAPVSASDIAPASAPTVAPAVTIASPTVKRITREMILEAIQPSSERAGDDTTATISDLPTKLNENGPALDDQWPKQSPIIADEVSEDKLAVSQRASILTVNLTENVQAPTSSNPMEGPDSIHEHPEITINAPDNSNAEVLSHIDNNDNIDLVVHDPISEANNGRENIDIRSANDKPESTRGMKLAENCTPSSPAQVRSRFSSSSPSSLNTAADVNGQVPDDDAIRFEIPQGASSTVHCSNGQNLTNVSNVQPMKSAGSDNKEDEAAELLTTSKKLQNTPCYLLGDADGEKYRDSNTTTDLVLGSRMSYGAASISSERSWVAKRMSSGVTTTDFRFSAFSQPSPLPDLKEESVEDISVVQPHISIGNFPLPGTMVFKRHSEANRSSEGSKVSASKSNSTALKESHDIPSLNFSRMDLFSKLNEALNLRSLDGLPFDIKDLCPSTVDRPASMNTVRQRYKSWFADYEDIFSAKRDSSTIVGPAVKSMSPEEFISEVNQLSIPSVNVLTERLTEWLPSIKNYLAEDTEVVEKDVENALEEIRSIGNRDSGMILPENVDEGTELTSTADVSSEQSRKKMNSVQSTDTWMSSVPTEKESTGKDAFVSSRSELGMTAAHVEEKTDTEFLTPDFHEKKDVKTPSNQSEPVTPSTARPWNHSGNYPWVDNSMKIDICFPLHSKKKTLSASLTPGHHRTMSHSTVRSSEELESSGKENVRVLRHSQSHSDIGKHASKACRRSVFNSFSQRLGLQSPRNSNDNSGYLDTLPSEERTVDPGDRYPTSALKPPSALNLEEVRSFFSDDSSQHEHVGNFRKRLTGRKSKRPHVSRVFSTESRNNGNSSNKSIFHYNNSNTFNENKNVPGNSESVNRNHGSFSVLHASGMSTHSFDATGGMSKAEFRARKVVEKVKSLWFRGGELLRTMSVKRRNGHGRSNHHDDGAESWLDDSDVNSNN